MGVPAGSTLTFRWTPPTTNTDGSALTDLRQYRVYEKVGNGPWIARIGIIGTVSKATYKPQTTGIHRYRITAINIGKEESLPSNEVEINLERPVAVPSYSPVDGHD